MITRRENMNFAAALITAGLSAPAFMRYKDINEDDRKKHGSGLWAAAVFAAADILTAFIAGREETGVFSMISMMIMLNFLFLLSFIDKNHRVIPNVYISGAFVLRTALILIQGIAEHSLPAVFISSLIGLVAGTVLTGTAYVVSRKGIGSGDVKMFAVIGYFAGGIATVDILIYSTVLCALCGILLLAFRKCGVKDRIPMAPFAFAGAMIYMITGM